MNTVLQAACDQGVTNWPQAASILGIFAMIVGVVWAASWGVVQMTRVIMQPATPSDVDA